MVDTAERKPVEYPTVHELLGLHADLVASSLQQAEDRLLNRAALEAALARPRQYAGYGDADPATQAAVLAHGVALDHPFVDGNKRTAFLALLAVLERNGWRLPASDAQIAGWIVRLVAGASANDFAAWIRRRLVRADEE